MTCILICNGRVIHDSLAYATGYERVTKMDKVQPFTEPVPAYSRRSEFVDVFLGAAVSGRSELAVSLIETLKSKVPLDNILDYYQTARERGLINELNTFEVGLIGLWGVVVINVGIDECTLKYSAYDPDVTTALGSGVAAFTRVMKSFHDMNERVTTPPTLPAMLYGVMAKEPTVAGWQIAYEIGMANGKIRLLRVGMNEPVSDLEINRRVSDPFTARPFDFQRGNKPIVWGAMNEPRRETAALIKARQKLADSRQTILNEVLFN